MFGSYVGIDLWPTTVRAVRLQRMLTGFGVQSTVSRTITQAPGGSPDSDAALIGCLAQLRAEGWGMHERVVVAVSEAAVLARKLEFPFTDRRKVNQVVPFELENLLPLGLEDVVIDYETLEVADGRTVVLGLAVQKAVFEHYLELLGRAELSVWRVTVKSLALRAYYDRFIRNSGEAVLLLNVELEGGVPTLTLCALLERRLCGMRTIVGARQDPAAPVTRVLAEPVLAEIRRTIHVWGQENARPFSQIYLSGQGCKWPGICALLAAASGIQAVDIVGPRPRESREHRCEPSLTVAAGLAALGAERRTGRLDFGRSQRRVVPRTAMRNRWGVLAVGLCVVLTLAFASLTAHYRSKERLYREVDAAVSALFRESFPEATAGDDGPRPAKSLLDEARKRGAFLRVDDLTIPQVLTELTSRIPKEVRLEIRELAVEAGRLWLEAETDSFEAVDRIRNELGRSAYFGDVSVSDARVGPSVPGVHFRIQWVLGHR